MDISMLTMKRIAGDYKLFAKVNPQYFDVLPQKDNILEIYFLLYGRPDSPYKGGQYMGKIVHNPLYPVKAPDYYVLTPNGRFTINQKICLTNSSFHQESWSPAAWNLVSMLEGFSSVWHSEFIDDKTGLNHINISVEEIKKFAENSIDYNMKNLKDIYIKFPKVISNHCPDKN